MRVFCLRESNFKISASSETSYPIL